MKSLDASDFSKLGLCDNENKDIGRQMVEAMICMIMPDPEQICVGNKNDNDIQRWNIGEAGAYKTYFYTYFTSPLRRHFDVMVHRLIKKIIKQQNMDIFMDPRKYLIGNDDNSVDLVLKEEKEDTDILQQTGIFGVHICVFCVCERERVFGTFVYA